MPPETNVDAARRLGWGHCVHFLESGLVTMEGGVKKTLAVNDDESRATVQTLEQLRSVWPEIFTTYSNGIVHE